MRVASLGATLSCRARRAEAARLARSCATRSPSSWEEVRSATTRVWPVIGAGVVVLVGLAVSRLDAGQG